MKFPSSFPASFIATGTLIRRFTFYVEIYFRVTSIIDMQRRRAYKLKERMKERRIRVQRERRERKRERESRERVRSRRRGLNKMEKMVLLCWWMHEEAVDRGSRRAAEFTPHLEKALFRALYPVCSFPFLLPLSAFSLSLSPFPASLRVQHLFHLLLLIFFFFFVFARLVNASQSERTLHT